MTKCICHNMKVCKNTAVIPTIHMVTPLKQVENYFLGKFNLKQ